MFRHFVEEVSLSSERAPSGCEAAEGEDFHSSDELFDTSTTSGRCVVCSPMKYDSVYSASFQTIVIL